MTAAHVLGFLGLIGFANALIAREGKVATAIAPPNFDFSSFNQSADMVARIASFMGSDAAKTQLMETVCDSASQGQPQHDAVISVLTPPDPITWRGGSILKTFESMHRIEDNNRAEVRLFHDEADDLSKEDMEKMFAAIRPRKVCATKIKFASFPEGFTLQVGHPEGLHHPMWPDPVPWGYFHMIRFNFVDLLDPSIGMLAGFKYWMRMDADTEWTAPIPDEFETFDKDGKLGYLHSIEMADGGSVTTGLNEFTRDFAKRHGIAPEQMQSVYKSDDISQVQGYYNNLEFGRIEMFQTPLALEYTKDIVSNHGIYKHRWGDALLRRIVVDLTGMKTQRVEDSTLKKFTHAGQYVLN